MFFFVSLLVKPPAGLVQTGREVTLRFNARVYHTSQIVQLTYALLSSVSKLLCRINVLPFSCGIPFFNACLMLQTSETVRAILLPAEEVWPVALITNLCYSRSRIRSRTVDYSFIHFISLIYVSWRPLRRSGIDISTVSPLILSPPQRSYDVEAWHTNFLQLPFSVTSCDHVDVRRCSFFVPPLLSYHPIQFQCAVSLPVR